MKSVVACIATLAACGAVLGAAEPSPRDISLGIGKSIVLESPADIRRVSVGSADVIDAVGVAPREVLISGKLAGQTSLIVWQEGAGRLLFNVTVKPDTSQIEAVRQQMSLELPGQEITVAAVKDMVFLRGTARDLTSAGRAVAIASTLGKVVNLLHVDVPDSEPQILLKVRFANIDRSNSTQLGLNLFSTGATNTIGGVSTQQFSPPIIGLQNNNGTVGTQVSLSDALNLFLYRPDLNLGATIRALQAQQLLEILAEPNLLAFNGKEASFLAGGEFPYPTVQGGAAGFLTITIQYREFGIKLKFTPVITPRGTIRLTVAPEVSSLDFANGLVYQGFNIPALSTRKVQTEIELQSGQSFAIAGLLDNRVTETLNKVPGLSSIPILGNLFKSRATSRTNSELLVMVTPEIVRPIPAGQALPEFKFPQKFLKDSSPTAPRTPGVDVTGPAPQEPSRQTLPVEQLLDEQKHEETPAAPAPSQYQLQPVPAAPGATAAQPKDAGNNKPGATD